MRKDKMILGADVEPHMPPEQSVLLPVIWLCALRRLTTLPTRSDSYIPAIQFSLWIQLMHSTGIFTPRNSANMVM